MKKNYSPNWEEIICWFECDDYEQLKGKIRAQKEVWGHEEELRVNAQNQKSQEVKKQ